MLSARVRRLSPAEVEAYDVVPQWVAERAIVIRVPVLPPGALGMTTGRFVLLKRDEPTDGSSTLIAHELVHVRQFAQQGRLLFGVRYFSAYLRHLVRLRNHRLAYLAIPAEVEAYASARRWATRQSGTTATDAGVN